MLHEVKDQRFTSVISPDSPTERLATGFGFTEGPVWDAPNDRLLFSDMKQDHMRSWSEREGIRTYRKPSNKANGNVFDRQRNLLSCEHSTSRIVRQVNEEEPEVLVTHFEGAELNSPNDIVVRSDGAIYFTDPTYGRIREDLGLVRPLQLDFRGVYRLDLGQSAPRLLARDFQQPNGLCFSIDEQHLFVNDTAARHIRRFDVTPDGLTGGEVWADVVGDRPGVPDGMKTDSAGNIYCSGPGGIHVFGPDAACLGVISTPESAANFTFGDDDLCSLFVTGSTSLYRLRTTTRGHLPY